MKIILLSALIAQINTQPPKEPTTTQPKAPVAEPTLIPTNYAEEGIYPVLSAKVNGDGATVSYEPNTNFKPCDCDMTSNSCDAFCCCDKFCDEVSIKDWTTSRTCSNIQYEENIANIKPLADCLN